MSETISCSNISNYITTGRLDYDYETIFEEIAKRFNRVPKMSYRCHNCGGELEIKVDQSIFKCPYCKSCYAIGTNMVNWK